MLIELLHDWVKYEPHICRYGLGTFRNTFFIQLPWGDWISISTSNPDPFLLDRGSLTKLIYFFQICLDSFGYGWVIQRIPNSSYTVTVSVSPNIYETSRCFVSRQESLIEALLEAYLKVIAFRKSRPVKEGI